MDIQTWAELIKYLSCAEFLKLRTLCSSIRSVLDALIENDGRFMFRLDYTSIPTRKQMKTLAPRHMRIKTDYAELYPEYIAALPSNLLTLKVEAPPVTYYQIGKVYRKSVPLDFVSPKLATLVLGYPFNQPIRNLPPTLTFLEFSSIFNKPLNSLPGGLTHLILGGSYNHPLDMIPSSLRYLETGSRFNQSVDKLPASLTHLIVGDMFNKPVNKLPKSLTHFTAGYSFNQPVDALPASLTHLYTGQCFTYSAQVPARVIHTYYCEIPL